MIPQTIKQIPVYYWSEFAEILLGVFQDVSFMQTNVESAFKDEQSIIASALWICCAITARRIYTIWYEVKACPPW